MPEVNTPQQQQPMELAPTDSGVITQQPDAQENMNTDMSLRGGCGESLDCCGITESCGCC
ncbi:hypothetical protein diail_11659 [Diaporthe ilicicola]|nr:hypothetical protein diail_11659 [Diaporthe ilicicola]